MLAFRTSSRLVASIRNFDSEQVIIHFAVLLVKLFLDTGIRVCSAFVL